LEKILFVTHKPSQCGVYEFGQQIFQAVSESGSYTFVKAICESIDDLKKAIASHKPAFILYNYHPSVMPWVCTKLAKGVYINQISDIDIPQVAIIHEVTQEVADTATAYRNRIILGQSGKRINSLFDFYIAADPTLLLKNPYVFKTGRLISYHPNSTPVPSVPTIGSFGFATPNKGFVRLVEKVKSEFKEAVVRINMPAASFGDPNGAEAKKVAADCAKSVEGTNIKLEITHDYLDQAGLIQFLSNNSINVFMYEDKSGRGISSATDLALASGRPIAVSDCPMFRHILQDHPSLNAEKNTLTSIMNAGFAPIEKMVRSWDKQHLIWDYNRIFDSIKYRTAHPFEMKLGIKRTLDNKLNRMLTRPKNTFTWLTNTSAATDDDLTPAKDKNYTPVTLTEKDGFNRILDDQARAVYQPAIEKLMELVPATMAKKIARANVQQAFVFDTVYRHLNNYTNPKLFCVGSYEDTASMALQKLGYPVEEVDPMINYLLQEYITKPTTQTGIYNIVFSTSVIEHDPHDQSFLECVEKLLAPGGIAVITCDFKEGWTVGQDKPEVDARFYTKYDMEKRMLSYLPNCELVDVGNWDCLNPDFNYLGRYQYTFATFTFRKK
jgi:glycosyltransferase involved in cell wall biosynthesis